MMKDLWLPIGFKIDEVGTISRLDSQGGNWQILSTSGAAHVLLASSDLAQEWIKFGYISESTLGTVQFGASEFRYLASHSKYQLCSVTEAAGPSKKVDALAFAQSLRESRSCDTTASLHDAIYVEKYSRLLPTWTLTAHVADDIVLGTWISGGVVLSAKSNRRMKCLVGWMRPCDLTEIMREAGLEPVPECRLRESSATQTSAATPTTAVEDMAGHDSNIEVSSSSFSLPGRTNLEKFINEHVIDVVRNPLRYKSLGIQFPSAFVLHGPPGCGKTYAVSKLAEFLDWPSFSVDSGSIGSPYIHETSNKISRLFSEAMEAAPSVIVIDEMESFLQDRAKSSLNPHHIEEVGEFLRRVPEAASNQVLVIAMTNQIDLIDSAILRRGRFDHIIHVEMPSRSEVLNLIETLLADLPTEKALDLHHMVESLTGRALSDAAFVIREAGRLAAKAGLNAIGQQHIAEALAILPRVPELRPRIGFVGDS